jgi:hypothetical protein
MSHHTLGSFATPQMLRGIRPDVLLPWLSPFREFFARCGLPQPESPAAASLDLDRLAAILMEPHADMPHQLLESLYLIRELGNEPGMDAIRTAAEARGIDLTLGDDATPLEVIMRAWCASPSLVESEHHRTELSRPRSFHYYSTHVRPVPPFAGPTPEQLLQMEQALNTYYAACRRGRGVRVTFVPGSPGEWGILIRHGAPCRREGAMQDDLPTSVFYRPQRHDALKDQADLGEIAVSCCSERERRILLRVLGRTLFGDPDFFPGTEKYTLAPLLAGRSCLACGDVPGIEAVALTEVDLHVPQAPQHRVIRKATDIFKLVETGSLQWPLNVSDIRRATFNVKFWRAPRSRRFTIVPCNRVIFGREEDSALIEKLMAARGFIGKG